MYWCVVCYKCGVSLKIDESGISAPDAEYKLIDGRYCENCRQDLLQWITSAVKEIAELHKEYDNIVGE